MPPTPRLEDLFQLSSHLSLGLPIGLFFSGLPINTVYAPLLSPTRATFPTHPILLDFITRIIFDEEFVQEPIT